MLAIGSDVFGILVHVSFSFDLTGMRNFVGGHRCEVDSVVHPSIAGKRREALTAPRYLDRPAEPVGDHKLTRVQDR
jgi:hypothetical protein